MNLGRGKGGAATVERPQQPSTQERFAEVLSRIAAATSIRRTRDERDERFEANGGTPQQLCERMEAALPDLERLARRLEA